MSASALHTSYGGPNGGAAPLPVGSEFPTEAGTGSFSSCINRVVTSIKACAHSWSYLGKIALLARQLLNAAANNTVFLCKASKNLQFTCETAKKLPGHIKNVTTHMKLLSVVGFIFGVFDLKAANQKLLNNVFYKDKEGIALSAISVTIMAADVLDSITTFVNTTLTLRSMKTVGAFSALGLPLGYIMSGLGIVSRTVQIAKSCQLYHKIQSGVAFDKSFNREWLKTFLEKEWGLEGDLKELLAIPLDQLTSAHKNQIQTLKEKNRAAILRAAPGDAVKDLETLLSMFDESTEETWGPEKMSQASTILRNIQEHLRKKMTIDTLGILANLFSLAALTIFTIGNAGSLPFLLLAIAFAIRLAALIYQDRKMVTSQ